MVGRKVNRIHAGASLAICVLALFASCRQKAVPLDNCGIVEAILNHKMIVRGEPEGRRVRPADDPCIQARALLHGKVLVEPHRRWEEDFSRVRVVRDVRGLRSVPQSVRPSTSSHPDGVGTVRDGRLQLELVAQFDHQVGRK